MISGIPYNFVLWDVSPIKHAVRIQNSIVTLVPPRKNNILLKLINYAALILSVIWLITSPSWEPAIVSLTLLGSLYTIYQKDVKVQGEDPAKYRIQNIIIFVFLIASLVIAKPSRQSHKGAMYTLEKKVEGVLKVNGEEKDISYEELISSFMAGALIDTNKESLEKNSDIDLKKQRAVFKAMYRNSLTKYYNFYIFSIAKQLRSYSIGILGYIIVRNDQGKMIVVTSTTGAIEHSRRTKELINTLLEK